MSVSLLGKLITLNESKAKSTSISKAKIKLGSHQDSDIVLLDLGVSLQHCEIEIEQGQWYLTNLSICGTLGRGFQKINQPQVQINNFEEIHLLQDKDSKANEIIGFTIVILNSEVHKQQLVQESEEIKTVIDFYQNQFSCSICTEIYYKPICVIPCLHTFCGACFSQWAREKENEILSCPNCRKLVDSARPNQQMQALVDIYLKQNPLKKQTAENMSSMDEQNSIKQEVFYKRNNLLLYQNQHSMNENDFSPNHEQIFNLFQNQGQLEYENFYGFPIDQFSEQDEQSEGYLAYQQDMREKEEDDEEEEEVDEDDEDFLFKEHYDLVSEYYHPQESMQQEEVIENESDTSQLSGDKEISQENEDYDEDFLYKEHCDMMSEYYTAKENNADDENYDDQNDIFEYNGEHDVSVSQEQQHEDEDNKEYNQEEDGFQSDGFDYVGTDF